MLLWAALFSAPASRQLWRAWCCSELSYCMGIEMYNCQWTQHVGWMAASTTRSSSQLSAVFCAEITVFQICSHSGMWCCRQDHSFIPNNIFSFSNPPFTQLWLICVWIHDCQNPDSIICWCWAEECERSTHQRTYGKAFPVQNTSRVIGLRHEAAPSFPNKRNKRSFAINWAELRFSRCSFQPRPQPCSVPVSPDCLQIPLREARDITAVWEQQQRAALGPWFRLKSGGAPEVAPLLEDTWAERAPITARTGTLAWGSVSYLTAPPAPWLGKGCELEIQMRGSLHMFSAWL